MREGIPYLVVLLSGLADSKVRACIAERQVGAAFWGTFYRVL